MSDRIQSLRSPTPGNTPTAGAFLPGELWTNFPDLQFGVIDNSTNPLKLIAVRYFSANANYVAGDFVVQGGKIYFAKSSVPAGAFNASQWTQLAAATDLGTCIVAAGPPAGAQGTLWWDSIGGQLFVNYNDGNSTQWVPAVNQGLGGLYLPLTGGTLSGALILNADPTTVFGAATKQYVDAGDAGAKSYADGKFLPLTGGTTTGNIVVNPAAGEFINLAATGGPATISLSKTASGQQASITGMTNGLLRWGIQFGDTTAESAGAGSNFNVNRYNDAGVYLDTPLQIPRSTGISTFTNGVTVGGPVRSTGFASPASASIGAYNNVDNLNYLNTIGLVVECTNNAALRPNKVGGNGAVCGFSQGGTACGSITVANANATAYNTTSDGRLKEDRREFDAGVILDQLEVWDFQWKGNENRGKGVIAQDAVSIFPDAITHDEVNDRWEADYSKFVPLLLQEIKALRARVAQLEAGAR